MNLQIACLIVLLLKFACLRMFRLDLHELILVENCGLVPMGSIPKISVETRGRRRLGCSGSTPLVDIDPPRVEPELVFLADVVDLLRIDPYGVEGDPPWVVPRYYLLLFGCVSLGLGCMIG